MMERTHIPILHKVSVKKKPKGIRKVSVKRRRLNDEYRELRTEFLREHPYCQWFMAEHGIDEQVAISNMGLVLHKMNGVFEYVNVPKSTQIHHKRGRVGQLLLDIRYFLAVSDEAHRIIHHDTKTSYEKGYMMPR